MRAARAARSVTQAQAAAVMGLAQARLAGRQGLAAEDEPFEFFRGFSEIFIATGLVILLSGVMALMALVGSASGVFLGAPLVMAVLTWWMAGYFTLRRRMVLPSIVLLMGFGIGVGGVLIWLFLQRDFPDPVSMAQSVTLAGAAAMGAWYWRFRLPVAMFFLGLSLLATLYITAASPADVVAFWEQGSIEGLFDLRGRGSFALATLVFGIGAFVAGMWFDTHDPHRLGRHAATGFWLHLLAAPALVNTIALTLLNLGGTVGMLSVAAALTGIAILALVIDRRSFLTAGIIYIAIVIAWLIRGEDGGDFGHFVAILLALGAFITALGTFWVQLRARLMRALPDFPGKSRLPPYDGPAARSIE